ncbi:asparagine synthetase [glutamine-hydrolyzing]-like [Paramacrobiotus metropolitanus]|uniref:asparagine synthetase [glutamine-hydrolyzing]-like n=1 Tax=Paramacrobiotus metropolitanus TaxID=2943436 RepID=UPI0024461334|nr:asparagine synthetase [glutamine-hydrolyzing]-like [Paramacrobiotus metropolitanus]
MCGIWGLFGSPHPDVFKYLEACLRIKHRGPDAFRIEGDHHLPHSCLAFHRLCIMDDLHGMQPLRLRKFPYLYLIYNGEIYNFRVLQDDFKFIYETSLDGEVLLHLYDKGGIELCAEQLDGEFAFCLIDTQKKKIFVGRDTYGVRPAFKMVIPKKGILGVSSEAKGLVELAKKDEYAGSQIEPIKPGHVETYNVNEQGFVHLHESKAFSRTGEMPKYRTLVSKLTDDVLKNIQNLLVAAVRKRLMSHRRIGCFLSGGLDSSLVAAILVKEAREGGISYPIQTFAIGMEGSTDLIAARKVAKHIQSEHHEVVFTPEEGTRAVDDVIYHLESYDITTVRASVGMYLISKYVREKTDTVVMYSGEGSDEVAQGYIYFHKAPTPAAGHTESIRLMDDLYMYDVLRADRTTAAHGLELRPPFLDHQFAAYYLSLPEELRVPKDGIEKHLLRSAFDGTDLLPHEILWRPKEAFSDGVSSMTKSWFQILQEFTADLVSDDEFAQRAKMFPHLTPATKEAFYYRKVFNRHYPGREKWIPYFWMPKWTDATDPSARTLNNYKPN